MVTQEKAQLAREWIDAWNQHDLERILSHYSEDIEFTSPFVVKLFNDPSGTIRGKETLRAYFEKGLKAYPDLHFELLQVLTGIGSLTLYYRSVNNLLAAEVMFLDPRGLIERVAAHYS
jgi:hypothetical protein